MADTAERHQSGTDGCSSALQPTPMQPLLVQPCPRRVDWRWVGQCTVGCAALGVLLGAVAARRGLGGKLESRWGVRPAAAIGASRGAQTVALSLAGGLVGVTTGGLYFSALFRFSPISWNEECVHSFGRTPNLLYMYISHARVSAKENGLA